MATWWQKGVIYQIYPRSFMDRRGDGVGDLAGVMSRLDYLAWLGIDAIWFSPLFPSPMADFGYDVADYEDIHPEYGTLAEFDALLEAAHQRGIRIILDLVPNHTSIEHPWFQESQSSRENPKRDWYIWHDPAPDGGLPNNWMSYFGGPAWTLDEASGQYYMHNFDPGQPELNWRNPEVPEAIFGAIRFWLARGVDGFRIDVIDRIIKDDQFRDNPLNPAYGGKWGIFDAPAVLRVYSEQRPEVHEYIRQFRQVFDEFPDTVAIGELDYDLSLEQIVAYYGAARPDGANDALHLPFNFRLVMLPWDAAAFRAHIDAYDAAIPPHGWPNYVLGNHDAPRIASKYGGEAAARVATMLLLTLRGTPTIYYGDEIGMGNVTIPEGRILDPQGRNKVGFNRDECRTPMQWDDSPNAGFSEADDTWLPLAEDYAEVNVLRQRETPTSMLNFQKALLDLRRSAPALHIGAYQAVDGTPEGTFVYLRQHADQRYIIALNFTPAAKMLDLSAYGPGALALSTFMDRDVLDTSSFELRPNEGVIIAL